MTFRNFELNGESLIETMAKEAPIRCARLVKALEEFIDRGADCGTPVAEKDAVVVFLTPTRHVLRGVPDAAALVLVDYQVRCLEIIEVIPEYGGDDGGPWNDLIDRAKRAIE